VSEARLTVWVSGRVQGVGFRWWARSEALAAGVDGWARNLPDGRVEIVAEGPGERARRCSPRSVAPDLRDT
jgi:acylphosphatase